ncbi:MAG TPA: BMP family ABC transporter substrate-binding protein [bacterium]|nr:BMP family ABC transporter substrate-binding protein [bacterium]HPJ71785.1 BMP family ABC transporter substrate-binding protein [bacterium]HPQ65337.1 BMP family ABC transporter substrate-binding protein [bacterium]
MRRTTRRRLLGVLFTALLCGCGVPDDGEPTNVAGVFINPLDDPWTAALHQALEQNQSEGGYGYAYRAGVGAAGYERAVREFVARGYRVVFGDCRGAEAAALATAREFPEVYFFLGSDAGPAAPNLAVIGPRLEEPAFLCGIVAARMSRTREVGVLAGLPSPSVNGLINAFRNGVESVDPAVSVRLRFTGFRHSRDHGPEARAVEALADAGADMVFCERPWGIEACERLRLGAFSCYQDLIQYSPDVVVTGAVWDPAPLVRGAVAMVKEDRFAPLDLGCWGTMSVGGAYLAPFRGLTRKPGDEVRSRVEKTRDLILDGRLRVPVDETDPAARLSE